MTLSSAGVGRGIRYAARVEEDGGTVDWRALNRANWDDRVPAFVLRSDRIPGGRRYAAAVRAGRGRPRDGETPGAPAVPPWAGYPVLGAARRGAAPGAGQRAGFLRAGHLGGVGAGYGVGEIITALVQAGRQRCLMNVEADRRRYAIRVTAGLCCGCRGRSSMVELQPSKLVMRVRFPSPAPVYLLFSIWCSRRSRSRPFYRAAILSMRYSSS